MSSPPVARELPSGENNTDGLDTSQSVKTGNQIEPKGGMEMQRFAIEGGTIKRLQGYLAHKKMPTPLGPP